MKKDIEAVRRFNRFYTREVGLLRKTFLDTPWTVGEMRVLLEIRNEPAISASEIARRLDLDPAYLSRLLSVMSRKGLVQRETSASDARAYCLHLTDAGRDLVNRADALQASKTQDMLQALTETERRRLVKAMATIESLLNHKRESDTDD